MHRDLKPENVILTRDGRVKILDFGVAKLRTDARTSPLPSPPTDQTESGVIVGTPGYMAPEQIRGVEADGRADVFALGAILFELLTGRRAFDRPSRAETLEATLRDDPLSSERSVEQWPPAVLRIVQRCLEKDAEARFQSAADLAFALDTVTEQRRHVWRCRSAERPPFATVDRHGCRSCCSPSAQPPERSGARGMHDPPATRSRASRSR